MNTIEVVLERARQLNRKGDLNRDLEVLLCHCINKSRAWLYAHSEYFVTDLQVEQFFNLVFRRNRGIPVAYLIGRREFWSLELEVNESTLIPRPETELLVQWALDLNLPERLGASFVDKDGTKKIPVMLHRALFGSLERFIGILIENYAGKLPFWLSPAQAVVCPIAEENNDYVKKLFEDLFKAGIKCEVDLRNEKINYKIREHSLAKIPFIIVCGKKEVANKTVTVRILGSDKQDTIKREDFIKNMLQKNQLPLN